MARLTTIAAVCIPAGDTSIEPALRFGLLDPDADAGKDRTKTWTAGVNWYIEGHALKIQADITRRQFDRNARLAQGKNAPTMLHVQNQIYF